MDQTYTTITHYWTTTKSFYKQDILTYSKFGIFIVSLLKKKKFILFYFVWFNLIFIWLIYLFIFFSFYFLDFFNFFKKILFFWILKREGRLREGEVIRDFLRGRKIHKFWRKKKVKYLWVIGRFWGTWGERADIWWRREIRSSMQKGQVLQD